jgi:hypothetical protein
MTTNKIYESPGTSKTFQDSGGDVTFAMAGIALGAGQASAQLDLTAASKPGLYKWEFTCRWVATPTLGDVVRLYAFMGTGTSVDISAGAVTPETKLYNFQFLGQVVCSVAADQAFYANGLVFLEGQYLVLAIWNASATKALGTSNQCSIKLIPYYPDIQAAA